MKKIITLLVSVLMVCGCKQKGDASGGPSAIDMVQPGQDINWNDGFTLRVNNRTSNEVTGVFILHRIGNSDVMISAERGVLSKGADDKSVALSVFNAETVNGKNKMTANKMDFLFQKVQ